jgi:hypothetical protein
MADRFAEMLRAKEQPKEVEAPKLREEDIYNEKPKKPRKKKAE